MADRSDLLAELLELLRTPVVTRDMLEAAIARCPELVGPEAQGWLSIISKSQEAPDAKSAIGEMTRILHRLGTENIEDVLSDEASRARERAGRLVRERRLREKKAKFHAEYRASPTATSVDSDLDQKALPSLSDVVSFLRSLSEAELIRPYGRDILGSVTVDLSVPKFLFRGESADYASTNASMARLRLGPRALEDIGRVRDRVVASLGEKCGLTNPEAMGFLQHYGFPTSYIDVTSNVSTAVSFACSLRVGDVGAVCIIPSEGLLRSGGLVDLRRHPMATRPRLQSAFALHLPQFPDLKAPEAINALQLQWLRFRFTDLDAVRFDPDFSELDARSDRVAGLIWLLIDDCAKFSDEAANLLSQRIDPAPVNAVVGMDGQIILVSEDESGPEAPVSDETFRQGKYEHWSDAFAEPTRQPLPPELERSLIRAPELKPGDMLRLLTTNVISGKSPQGQR